MSEHSHLAATPILLGLAFLLTSLPGLAAVKKNSLRSCSITNDELLRVASWDLERVVTADNASAHVDIVAMLRSLNAEVVALQGLTAEVKELNGALQSLGKSGRCYGALVSSVGLATLFDSDELEVLYTENTQLDCRGSVIARGITRERSAGELPEQDQLSYLRVKSTHRQASAFDFILLNADVETGPAGLERLAERYNGLSQDYPLLANEKDRIVIGDLAVDPSVLTRSYFQDAKPLINLLLKVNLGLSNKTFDEAVVAARSGVTDPNEAYDNILVQRWDSSGLCAGDSMGYCGGLEEFINARVYSPAKAGGQMLSIGKSAHPPISGRFCKFADSDPPAVVAR